MKVSFVIPSYNNFPLVNQLLVDIFEHTHADEIIVVDDCSSDRTALDGLLWWSENYNVKIVKTPENLGFLKASNFGLKQAAGDIIFLISTDVRVKKNLPIYAEDALKSNSKTLLGGIVYEDSTGWNKFGEKVFPYMEGWCLATGKDQWKELGYFDERYAPHDFEDVDLSTTAISMGYTLFPLAPNSLEHIGAATIGYTESRRELTERNREKFRQKWLP